MLRTLQRSPAYFRTLHQLHTVTPEGFLAKIRFRKDGSSRSKLIGVVNVSLSLATLYCVRLSYEQRQQRLREAGFIRPLLAVIKMQDVDIQHYDRVNLDDPQQCFDYFFRLAYSFCPEETHASWKELEASMRPLIELCHTPMREVVEDIYREFQRFAEDPIAIRAFVMVKTIENLLLVETHARIKWRMLDTVGAANLPHVSPAVDPPGSEKDYGTLG